MCGNWRFPIMVQPASSPKKEIGRVWAHTRKTAPDRGRGYARTPLLTPANLRNIDFPMFSWFALLLFESISHLRTTFANNSSPVPPSSPPRTASRRVETKLYKQVRERTTEKFWLVSLLLSPQEGSDDTVGGPNYGLSTSFDHDHHHLSG